MRMLRAVGAAHAAPDFRVTVTEASAVDAMNGGSGIPANLRSFHTSVVSGYRVEGHVPIDVVRRC